MRGLKRSIREWKPVSYFGKGGRWLILLLCILLAAIIWLIQTLDNTYTKSIEMSVVAPVLPDSYSTLGDKNLPEVVEVRVTARGGRLFGFALQEIFSKTPPLKLVVDTLLLDPNGGYWSFTGEELTRQVRNSYPLLSDFFKPGEVQINVRPDVIGFNYEQLSERKLPVYFNSQVDLGGESNRLLMSLELIPDEVTAYGPSSLLDKIELESAVISTDTLPLIVQSDSVSYHRVALLQPEGVRLFPDSVTVRVNVELLAYNSFVNTDIAVRNLPEGYVIRLFPSAVKITFLALSDVDVDEIKSEIMLYVDADDIAPGSNKLKVRLRQIPEEIHMIQLEPDRVEYIVEER